MAKKPCAAGLSQDKDSTGSKALSFDPGNLMGITRCRGWFSMIAGVEFVNCY